MEAQRNKIEQYCSLYGLELVEAYKDASSGKTMDRPGLQDALKAIKGAKDRCFVAAKLDRLTCSERDLGDLLASHFNNGHPLKIVVEQIDTGTAAGRMVANMLVTVAQWERETISERTKDALAAAKRRRTKLGNPNLSKVQPKAWKATSAQA
ncbi:MAG: recombinase family protein [Proteobacteria bacterium]|nr:recombinase family protein [Pseudomonadota bacterium]MBU4385343.1 recombinase family protein [Pseudomonadota bacterium]MCG2764527.1 recombinase family protein [Desulfarculaceae bacterium]